jgi:hypothetical protein
MSAFANNPWVKKDKQRADGINAEPEIKKPTRAPRKITKNPFAEDKKEEPPKPKVNSTIQHNSSNVH